jgi:predicted lactoylglutathione lyase
VTEESRKEVEALAYSRAPRSGADNGKGSVMEPRISLITLGVADVARSRVFYEALGWRASSASQPEVAFFQANGLALTLFSRQALADDASVKNSAPGFSGIALAYNGRSKADVDEVHAAALAAGAKPVKKPHDTVWGGYSGYFADPDGHLWEVAWNPFFALDEQGNLSLPDSSR